jgi:hypothetical protein
MMRVIRIVDPSIWRLSDALGERRSRLLNTPSPSELRQHTITQAIEASRKGLTQLDWQESCECRGYFRLVAQIPLSETTFDQLFNGPAGYRAQYYLSPDEGVLYNRDILSGLEPALRLAYVRQPLGVDFSLVEKSIRAPHSKIWVFGEQKAFDDAADNTLNPPRWVENDATRGRKAPLPKHFMIDVKGAFLHPASNDLFVDELKLDRACDLFRTGYT